MPQITVDYSANLNAAFDREGFAAALHPMVVEMAEALPAACKTRFHPSPYALVGPADENGEGDESQAVVHITIGLLPGRSDETKARLAEAVLQLLGKHVEDDGLVVNASAEVRELGPSYRKLTLP